MNRSCGVSAVMWAMPAASRTTVTGAPSPGTVRSPVVWGRARPVSEQQPAPTPTTTTTQDDRRRSDQRRRRLTTRTQCLARAASAGAGCPRPAAVARAARSASPKMTSARPTPEVGDDHATGRAPGAGEDRLAEGRGRIGIAVELAGVPVGQELPTVVDEEQARRGRDLGRQHRRVVDRHDERVRRESTPSGSGARRAPERGHGDDDVGIRRGRGRRPRRPVTAPMPGVARASLRERLGTRRRGGRGWPGGRRAGRGRGPPDGLRPATPAPMSAARTGGRATAGPNRAIATPDTAAVRWAVIGPPSRIADRHAGRRVVEDDDRVDGRQPSRRVGRAEPGDPLDPEVVARASRSRGRAGRPAWRARTNRRDADGRRSWAAARRRRPGRSSSARPGPVARRASAWRLDVGRREVAQGRQVGASAWPRQSRGRGSATIEPMAPIDVADEPRQPQARARRDRALRRPVAHRAGSPARRGVRADRRATSAATPTSGRPS